MQSADKNLIARLRGSAQSTSSPSLSTVLRQFHDLPFLTTYLHKICFSMTKLWAECLRNHGILAGARYLSLLQNTETGSTAHPALYSNGTSPFPEHFVMLSVLPRQFLS